MHAGTGDSGKKHCVCSYFMESRVFAMAKATAMALAQMRGYFRLHNEATQLPKFNNISAKRLLLQHS
jgi:hypothetical protein